MASSPAAVFKPYTDNFGSLTLHATILGDNAVTTPEDRQASIHMLSVLAFVLALVMAIAAIYAADKAFFGHHDHTQVAYSGMAIDAD